MNTIKLFCDFDLEDRAEVTNKRRKRRKEFRHQGVGKPAGFNTFSVVDIMPRRGVVQDLLENRNNVYDWKVSIGAYLTFNRANALWCPVPLVTEPEAY